jgi:hypothetical protein
LKIASFAHFLSQTLMGHPSPGKCVKVYDGLCLECGYILSPFTSLSPSATAAIFCHEVYESRRFVYFVAGKEP